MDPMGRSEHPNPPEDALGIFIEAMVCSRGSPSAPGPESAGRPERLTCTYIKKVEINTAMKQSRDLSGSILCTMPGRAESGGNRRGV